VPLGLKVGCPYSGAGCDIALVSIFLCVGLMAIFVVLRLTSFSFLLMCILFLSHGVVCLGCWWSFCVFRCHCDGRTTELSSKINLG
jgi:hypothetical protein